VAVALILVAVCSRRFWSETLKLSQPNMLQDLLFLLSVFAVLVAAHASVLLLLPGRLLKALAAFLLIAGAAGAYFADSYGVLIDRDMIRNVVETDVREAFGLVNVRFGLYLLLLGIVPAVVVLRTRLARPGLKRALAQRGAFITMTIAICALSAVFMGAHYASFLREHKSLRYLITPANIVNGAVGYFSHGTRVPAQLVDRESPVSRVAGAQSAKPLVLFLVIGETARAQNFQLGGYKRPTNPELSKRDVRYFGNVSSCGTSTAISLPCMFSGDGRKAFDASNAAGGSNLLDALAQAQIAIEWRDNNAGCKGICARVPASIDYRAGSSAEFCNAGGCYDEVMLADVPERLQGLKTDTVIVFHQAGSHGPAYSQRYPAKFEVFKPVCYGNELSRCAVEEVVNAYDNSILYTDYNLARQIDLLESASQAVDSLLMYVSDHGESLGERGLYLHGAPYMFAPAEQTQVPLVLWMSAEYRKRFAVSDACVRAKTGEAFSHDNLYHTVLGALGVNSARYRASMDMLASCRSAARAADAVVGSR
jgi:lipid A ethanolaminephosphotransferase